jgi:nitrogen fixation NifU-like protein
MPAIASSDVICKLAKGKSLDDALKITFKDIINELGDLPAIKYHCSVLGTQALKKAIENYKKEHKN